MHVNTHVAIGVLITTISTLILPLTNLEFFVALGGSFIQDFDILFSKYAPDENHRLLFTHSIWLGVITILIGWYLSLYWVIIAGINSVCHVLIDSIDWGVAILGEKTLYGPRILRRENNLTAKEIKARYPNYHCYFTIKWFCNRTMRVIEASSIIGMVSCLLLLNDPFKILVLIIYGFFAGFHYILLFKCIRQNPS